MNESWLVYECITSNIWMSHVAHMKESHHAYEWITSRLRMSQATRINESCHAYDRITSRIQMSHAKHHNVSCHTYEWVTRKIGRNRVTHMNKPATFRIAALCIQVHRWNAPMQSCSHSVDNIVKYKHATFHIYALCMFNIHCFVLLLSVYTFAGEAQVPTVLILLSRLKNIIDSTHSTFSHGFWGQAS